MKLEDESFASAIGGRRGSKHVFWESQVTDSVKFAPKDPRKYFDEFEAFAKGTKD